VRQLQNEGPEIVGSERFAHAESVPRRCAFVSARMICVTRAREIPSRRAIWARDATSPESSCRCHSTARASRDAGPRTSVVVAARRRFLARAKSKTRHVAKFLFEADLGSR
jgi:hypothetical protein